MAVKTALLWNRSTVLWCRCENSMAVGLLSGQEALGPGPSPARQVCCASGWSPLLFSAPLYAGLCRQLFQLSQGEAIGGKGKYIPQARGELAYMDSQLCPVPDLSVLMHIRALNHCSLIGSKGTVLIVHNTATLIGWGKPQSYWLKYDSRKPL